MSKNSKKINLDGKTWIKYSISVWDDIAKDSEEIRTKHPAMFPKMLVKKLLEIFTHEYDVVIDPFVGVGSTLIAAKELKRHSIGIELSPEFFEIANNRILQGPLWLYDEKNKLIRLDEESIKKTPIVFNNDEPIVYNINGDAKIILDYLPENLCDFCVTSPPYWDILTRKRTADKKETRKYSDDERDIGNINNYEEFLSELIQIFYKLKKTLKSNAMCAVVVMDVRKKSNFYPFHMDLTFRMKEIGYILEDIIIWDRKAEYNNIRPLGYPYKFIVNKVHEYIMLFRNNKP